MGGGYIEARVYAQEVFGLMATNPGLGPRVNPDRHARIRLKHFTRAILLGLAGHMAHGEFGDDDFAMVWSPSMLSLGVGYLAAADACDWGVA